MERQAAEEIYQPGEVIVDPDGPRPQKGAQDHLPHAGRSHTYCGRGVKLQGAQAQARTAERRQCLATSACCHRRERGRGLGIGMPRALVARSLEVECSDVAEHALFMVGVRVKSLSATAASPFSKTPRISWAAHWVSPRCSQRQGPLLTALATLATLTQPRCET